MSLLIVEHPSEAHAARYNSVAWLDRAMGLK
jgi:hypothetical protein